MIKTMFTFMFLILTPFSFSAEKVDIVFSELVKKNVSFVIDEVERIYKRIGVEPTILIYPESRLIYLFEKGQIDALGAKVELYGKSNPDTVKVDVPILEDVEFRIFIRANQLERVKKLKDPVIISAQNCIACQEFAKVHNLKVTSLLGNVGMALKVLYFGRADMVIAPSTIVSKLPKGMFKLFGEKSYKVNFYHFLNKSKIHLKAKLEVEFKKSRKNKAFDLKQLGSLEHILK